MFREDAHKLLYHPLEVNSFCCAQAIQMVGKGQLVVYYLESEFFLVDEWLHLCNIGEVSDFEETNPSTLFNRLRGSL